MHLNHPAGGISMEKMLGQCSLLILCGPGREQAWVTDSIALGTEFTSCLEDHSALGSGSSVLRTQASHSHGSADRIVWKNVL